MRKIKSGIFTTAFVWLASPFLPSQACFAQSTDPDSPTLLTESTINGMNSSNMSEDNTYCDAFDVKKGTLPVTLAVKNRRAVKRGSQGFELA